MGTSTKAFVTALMVVGLAELSGCVTDTAGVSTDDGAATLWPAAEPASEAGTATGSATVNQSAASALSGDPSLDWQQTLNDDVTAVSKRGNAFLEASFKLYDQLLDESATTPPRQMQLSASLQESADLYAELTTAVDRLRIDLAKQEIKEALPLKGEDAEAQYAGVAELVKTYHPQTKRTLSYDGKSGPGASKLIFADKQVNVGEDLGGLPKPQRDALQLLDSLQQVSSDMSYLSETVSDWVDVRDNLLDDESEIAH